MKIRYTEFCLNPALRNTTTHLPQHRAIALIDSGAAVEVPLPQRGTAEWLQERNELEAERVKNLPQTSSPVPVWTVRTMPLSQRLVVQYQNFGTQLTYGPLVLEGGKIDHKQFVGVLKSAKCPEAVIHQWLEAAQRPDYLEAEAAKFDADKRAHLENEQRLKNRISFI
jgi:hypothetical protein